MRQALSRASTGRTRERSPARALEGEVKEIIRRWIRRLILWACPEITEKLTQAPLAPAAGAHGHHGTIKHVPGAHALLLTLLLIAAGAHAQQGGQTSNAPPLTGSVAPAGNCGVGSLYVNTTTGDLYDCNAGSWNRVGAGSSGAFNGGLGTSYQDAGGISAPANPASGDARIFFNSGTNLFNCLTSTGANCFPSGGAGTVTQVTSGNFSPLFNVSVAANTTTPAFSFAGISQSQNLFFASPNGSSGAGAFRAVAAADLPASANSCAAHQFTISLAAGFNVTCAQPAAADIGSIPGASGQLLYNNAGAIGAEDPVISYNNPSETTAAWTSGTSQNTALTINLTAGSGVLSAVVVTLNQGSTITAGQVTFYVSDTTAATNIYPIACRQVNSGGLVNAYTLTANTNTAFICNVTSFESFQVKLTTAIAGTGTVDVGVQPTSGPVQDGLAITNTVPVGGLGSGATGGDLIGLPVGDTYKAINISTATTTLIVTGASGRQVRISAQHMIAAAADNVAWIEGTTTTSPCDTGTAGMAGGTTAASGYNFAANGGIAEGSGIGTIMQTATTGDSVCIVTSAAVQLSGGIEYTIY